MLCVCYLFCSGADSFLSVASSRRCLINLLYLTCLVYVKLFWHLFLKIIRSRSDRCSAPWRVPPSLGSSPGQPYKHLPLATDTRLRDCVAARLYSMSIAVLYADLSRATPPPHSTHNETQAHH